MYDACKQLKRNSMRARAASVPACSHWSAYNFVLEVRVLSHGCGELRRRMRYTRRCRTNGKREGLGEGKRPASKVQVKQLPHEQRAHSTMAYSVPCTHPTLYHLSSRSRFASCPCSLAVARRGQHAWLPTRETLPVMQTGRASTDDSGNRDSARQRAGRAEDGTEGCLRGVGCGASS